MILSHDEILKAIESGRIKITPFDPALVGPCSVDMRLGYAFKRLKTGKNTETTINNNFKKLPTELVEEIELKENESLKLPPQELVLGSTLERLKLDETLSAKIEGRSTLARAGLLVHVSASLIQPGVDNVQVLEIMNVSPFAMHLYPKTRICQIVFSELKGKARYKGAFARQTKP